MIAMIDKQPSTPHTTPMTCSQLIHIVREKTTLVASMHVTFSLYNSAKLLADRQISGHFQSVQNCKVARVFIIWKDVKFNDSYDIFPE